MRLISDIPACVIVGIDDETRARKIVAIEAAIARNAPDPADPLHESANVPARSCEDRRCLKDAHLLKDART